MCSIKSIQDLRKNVKSLINKPYYPVKILWNWGKKYQNYGTKFEETFFHVAVSWSVHYKTILNVYVRNS